MEILQRVLEPSGLDEFAAPESKPRRGVQPLPPATGETVRILLVDDVSLNLEILRETLRPLGHTLLVATSGRQCLSTSPGKARPPLVLLDVVMPEMDGLEVCRQLKADPILQHVPVIFCSALDDTDAKVRGLDAGAVDFISKPYEPAEVVARVNTHLALTACNEGLEAAQPRAGARADPGLRIAPRRAPAHAGGCCSVARTRSRRLRASIADEARSSLPLLLLAEPSCGDEAVARAIHDASARRTRPFVPVECGQMLNCDLEAALQDPNGPEHAGQCKLALAAGGTLFLSGVQHLSRDLQEQLSRAPGRPGRGACDHAGRSDRRALHRLRGDRPHGWRPAARITIRAWPRN